MNPDQNPDPDHKSQQPGFWPRLLALVFVVGISLYIFLLPESQINDLQRLGYPGVFLFSLITNATIFLPAPSLVLVFSIGARLNPFSVGLAAGLGATIGELSGYLAGFSGQAIIHQGEAYERMVKWVSQHGTWAVIILAFIPNPLFDLTGIAAGALKMPLWRFMLFTLIGKFFKMLLVALAGAGLIHIPLFMPD